MNITSLPKHLEELKIFLQQIPFEILSLNETRLDDTIENNTVRIPGYNIIRRDRNRRGGGVAILVKNNYSYIVRNDLLTNDLEAICIELTLRVSRPILILNWYRPPDSEAQVFDWFEEFLQKAEAENKELIILGDLNCDLYANMPNSNTKKLVELINAYQLKQLIKEPTRVTANTRTLIDVIITQLGNTNVTASGVVHIGISDHSLVYTCRKISTQKGKPKIVEIRQFKNFNRQAFERDLNQAFAGSNVYHHNDPNEIWKVWKTIFLAIADKHAPLRHRKVRSNYNPWITAEIKNLSHHRDFLKKKAVTHNSIYYFNEYKKCRNNLNKTIKDTKSNYYKNKFNACKDHKENWKLINELLNNTTSKTTIINELIVDGEKTAGDENIANEFNSFFSRIGPSLAENINPSDVDPLSFITPVTQNFDFQNISHDEIWEEIKQMKTTKSSGYDKISMRLLQAAGSSILDPLAYIFNQSLRTGIFPDDWKIAKVTPIHKADEKNLCSNYRPVSVISTVPKLFEKAVYKQLMQYLEQHQIISKFQSGFRASHSTETLLLQVTNNWLRNMDAGLINGVLFLDLKKAFDTINHEILLSKLERYGIRGLPLLWFQSYLNNRKQICKINNSLSNFQNVSCGIPQGSNLGPLLFLIYINDLPDSLEITEPAMFADDTNLTGAEETSAEIQNKLEGEIQNVLKWLRTNKLTLNEKKTEYMLIGSAKRLKQIQNDLIIKINDHVIKRVYNKNVLGLEIDDKLKWTEHVQDKRRPGQETENGQDKRRPIEKS